jgi:uncharacterized membrane protein YhiD involved in acid resistance
MLPALHLAQSDSSSCSRTVQSFLSGTGFLGDAIVIKRGVDVNGIKAAAGV